MNLLAINTAGRSSGIIYETSGQRIVVSDRFVGEDIPFILKKNNVDIQEIDQSSFDLSVKNPNKEEEAPLRDPQEILAEIAKLDSESAKILAGIREMV